jgi:hypothetical protein
VVMDLPGGAAVVRVRQPSGRGHLERSL